jgi:hypothetical protein
LTIFNDEFSVKQVDAVPIDRPMYLLRSVGAQFHPWFYLPIAKQLERGKKLKDLQQSAVSY